MSLGIPLKLLHEATGHIVSIEVSNGATYRGKLDGAEDNMNVQLRDITLTARDGRVSHLERVYIRGSHIRFFVVPDMLKQAPMFKATEPGVVKGTGRGKVQNMAERGRGRGR